MSGNDCQLHTHVPVPCLVKCCDQERNKSGNNPQLAEAVCASCLQKQNRKNYYSNSLSSNPKYIPG